MKPSFNEKIHRKPITFKQFCGKVYQCIHHFQFVKPGKSSSTARCLLRNRIKSRLANTGQIGSIQK